MLSFLLRSGFESRIWSSFVCTQCKIHSSTACTNWGVSKWRCSKRVALRPATCESDLKSAASSIPPPLKTWKPSWGTTSTAGPTWRRTTQKTHPSNFTRLQTEQIRPLRVILYDSPSFRPRSRDISLGSHFFCYQTKKWKPIKKGIRGRAFTSLSFLKNVAFFGLQRCSFFEEDLQSHSNLTIEKEW